MTKIEQLITEIDAFCRLKGLSERDFGWLVANHPKFLTRLRANTTSGRSIDAADRFLLRHGNTPAHELHAVVDTLRPKVRSPDPVQAAA